MKLLLLGLEDHRRPGSGGGSQRNHEVNGRLASRGHEILVLVADHRGSCARVEDGVRYQHLGIPFGYKPSLVAYHAMLPLVLPRLVHEFDPDVLVEEFAPPVSSVGICRLWRRPSVGLVHGYFAREKAAQYHLPLRPTLAIERWGTRSHRYLITNSWDVAQELKANAPGSQVVICGTGLDHDAITAAVGDEDARLRLTSARHIVYLGRLEFHQKGLDLLLEALDSIAGDDWRLSIAGDGPDATRLSAAVEQAPWRDKVTLLGRVAGPEKWRLLASGAVFVMPSRYETFGRVALEAMSVGTPVAAFEIANLRDTLGTDAALMAQPFDTAALGQALLRAIGDTEWSGRAAQAALARSRKRNWDAVALEHEAVYRAALEGHDVVTDEALKPVVAATDGDLPLAAGSGSGQQVGANAPGPPPVATAPVGKYGTGKRQRQKKGKGIGVSSASGEYDYVIAGGGTAGCILAGLLSRRPDVTVLLIEAGRRDHSPLIHLPSGTGQLRPSVYDWGFSTVPQAHCDGRRIPYRQAKVLGGGGSVNAQVYTRGAPADYDDWAKEHRCVGWSYDEVLPYFVRSEANTRLSAPWHGSDGPLAVSDLAVPNPVSLAFVRAGQEFGLPYNPDFNGATQYGVGLYQSTTRNGQRCSAATAYLRPARGRPNLRVETGWLARRVLFEGERAVGLEVSGQDGLVRFRARREVVLAAGAIGSPKILQLSGVGDPAHLKEAGVELRHALPGVGRNFHDQCTCDLLYELHAKQSLDRFTRPGLATFAAGVQYAVSRTGPYASNIVEAGAFSSASGEAGRPDFQFHFVPAAGPEAVEVGIKLGHRAKLDAYFLNPRSRGSVLIASADPSAAPRVDPRYLEDGYDLEMAVEAVKQGRDIMAQPSMARLVKAERLPDGAPLASRKDYVRFVRRAARTSYHPVGTCAMGDTEDSVVSPELKVHGLVGLRVVDASVMPTIVSSNTQAPTVMIAEKGSDLILSEC